MKITKRAFKCFATFYNIKILNPFNSELKLKDTQSQIKNKLIHLMTQLKGERF